MEETLIFNDIALKAANQYVSEPLLVNIMQTNKKHSTTYKDEPNTAKA